MRIRVQVILESDQEAIPLHVEEVACFNRDQLSPETLGLRLEEAKQMLAGVQRVMTESQVEEYVEQQRQCPHCQQPLTYKGHHQIGVRTLFGKLTLPSPRLYTCSCQPHQKRSWSPVAMLFTERCTPELLCQEVRWASLLSYGVTAKLLGDLLPMEHQLSTSTISRHVHQVAELLEGELGDEQPSFIEGCPDQWYKLPEPGVPLVVSLDGGYVHARLYLSMILASIPNYGDRYRNGEAISSAVAESSVNQVISKRFVKKQQMRWTRRGAHLLLQVRTQVLDDTLTVTFQRWYPGMGAGESRQEPALTAS